MKHFFTSFIIICSGLIFSVSHVNAANLSIDKELVKAFKETMKQQTLIVESNIDAEYRGDNGEVESYKIMYETVYSPQVKEKQLHKISASSNIYGAFAAEGRLIEDNVYLKIDELPDFIKGFFDLGEKNSEEPLRYDTWYTAPITEIIEQGKGELEKRGANSKKLSKAELTQLIKKATKEVLVPNLSLKKNPSEAREYNFELNTQEFLLSLADFLVKEKIISIEEKNQYLEDLDTSRMDRGPLQNLKGTIILSSGNRAIIESIQLDLQPLLDEMYETIDGSIESVHFGINFTKSNQGDAIELPEETYSLQEAFQKLAEQSAARYKDQETEYKLNDFMGSAEFSLYEKQSYDKVCNLKDPYTGKSYKQIFKEMGADFNCYDSKDKFVAYAKLPTKNTYFCVDSKFSSYEVSDEKDLRNLKKSQACPPLDQVSEEEKAPYQSVDYPESTQDARAKGADAVIKSTLSNARVQGEVYIDFSSSYSYKGVCKDTKKGIKDGLDSAKKISGKVECYDSETAWVAASPLKSDPKSYYCVDNKGYAITLTSTKDIKKNMTCGNPSYTGYVNEQNDFEAGYYNSDVDEEFVEEAEPVETSYNY